MLDHFARVFVVNLDCRPDRWETFKERVHADWPFQPVARYEAIDGRLAPPPGWWKAGAGAWGCYRTHLKILEECLTRDIDSVLIFEDDALFVDDFAAQCEAFFRHLPDDWGYVYLGGQHLEEPIRLPRQVNDWVYRPYNINRLHAYGLRGRGMMEAVYKHLNACTEWAPNHHIDHHLGELHKRLKTGVYVPRRWLVGQDGGVSNINGDTQKIRMFLHAEDLLHGAVDLRMVPVLGAYRGGTSRVAGVLHRLGVDMGDKFQCTDEQKPEAFFEAPALGAMCRRWFEEPWLVRRVETEDCVNLLRRWAADRCSAVREHATTCGGKHPLFCCLGPELLEAWNNPYCVVVDRPIEETIRSLKRLNWGWPNEAVDYLVPKMLDARDAFLRDYAPKHYRVAFKRLLLQPEPVLRELCEFLEITPTDARFQDALAFARDVPC